MTYYVYFVEAGNQKKSPVKIGVTTNIDERIKALQTGNPYELNCRALIECGSRKEAYGLESYLHSRLRKLRLRGEWFRSEYFDLKEILSTYSRKSLSKKAKANSLPIVNRYVIKSISGMAKELSAARNDILELEAEVDALNDELESRPTY